MPSEKIALVSVYDKSGLEGFARKLVSLQFKIISTGGTAKFFKDCGVPVQEVSDFTGSPEILEGRVKTLHPKIHAGILARQADLGVDFIDLVVVNLYPFETTPTIENIDIGGPTMLRAAAKNFERVTVVCDPKDYDRVVLSLEKGSVPVALRRELARKVFTLTARYERAIADYFQGPKAKNDVGNSIVHSPWSLVQSLRYGENPHQKAALYLVEGGELLWEAPLQGKELSYNNILDADAAWWLIKEFQDSKSKDQNFVCAIIKHTNPCGVALSEKSLVDAFEKALACDPNAAFGGIVGFNREVDKTCAESLSKIFLEVILAPAFSREALTILSEKKNLRLLVSKNVQGPSRSIRTAGGGQLVQEVDRFDEPSRWLVKTKRQPTPEEMKAFEFAWKIAKHVKSNAVVFSSEDQTLGIGAGQTSRVGSVKVAVTKFSDLRTQAPTHSSTVVVASDAFFPFPDNIEEIAKTGATAVIQPGGSIKDKEVIAEADTHNLAMIFTGVRHFRH